MRIGRLLLLCSLAAATKLKQTADDLGSPGVDPVYGFGRVNAHRAVTG